MKYKINNFIKKLFISRYGLYTNHINFKNDILNNSQPLLINSFGGLNQDKIFYVIQQDSRGRGLFSIVSAVVSHIDFALKNGFIPVVDLKNFNSEYRQSESDNVWNAYFDGPSKFTLEEVYQSKNVYFSTNTFPLGYEATITENLNLYKCYQKYIRLNSNIDALVTKAKIELNFSGNKILGVHFRGKESRRARNHFLPPSKRQIYKLVDVAIKNKEYTKIFVVSEDPTNLLFLKKRYGDMVQFLEMPRARFMNTYRYADEYRPNHRYKLGEEVLQEMQMLSECNGFIGCVSNISNFAIFINQNKFQDCVVIKNPQNSKFPIISMLKWYVMNLFPNTMLGFKDFKFEDDGKKKLIS